MLRFTLSQNIRRLLIRSRYRKWILPFVCAIPYLFSYFWLLARGQAWISNTLLAPIVMGLLLGLLTLILARCEFRR